MERRSGAGIDNVETSTRLSAAMTTSRKRLKPMPIGRCHYCGTEWEEAKNNFGAKKTGCRQVAAITPACKHCVARMTRFLCEQA